MNCSPLYRRCVDTTSIWNQTLRGITTILCETEVISQHVQLSKTRWNLAATPYQLLLMSFSSFSPPCNKAWFMIDGWSYHSHKWGAAFQMLTFTGHITTAGQLSLCETNTFKTSITILGYCPSAIKHMHQDLLASVEQIPSFFLGQ